MRGTAAGCSATVAAGDRLMMIALHKMARTAPAERAETAASDELVVVLVRCYGVSQRSIRRWKGRINSTTARTPRIGCKSQ